MTLHENSEAEDAVLSVAFQNPAWLERHLHTLPPAVFSSEQRREIFIELVDLATEGVLPDSILVTNRLRSRGALEKVGGPAFVSEVSSGLVIPSHAEHYLGIVKQAFLLRQHTSALESALELLRKTPAESEAVTGAALEQVKEMIETASRVPGQQLKRRKVGVVARQVLGEIEERIANPGKLAGYSTGFATIDSRTGGAQPGHVWVFAGLPGDGKSTALQNVAEAGAQQGARVGWYPLEMPDSEQTFRLMSASSGIDNETLYRGSLNRAQQGDLGSAVRRLEAMGIEMVDTDGATATDIICDIERSRYDIVVVDYLQLMDDAGRKGASREEIIAGISRRLKRAAKKGGTCVLTASQLNDSGKLRESRAIGQDADKVFLINKCPFERADGKIVEDPAFGEQAPEHDDTRRIWWCDKNRGGRRHWEMPMHFLGQTFQFREIEQA